MNQGGHAMAWEFGYFSVEAGQELAIDYWFGPPEAGGGEDRGAQFAMCHTLEGYGATLYVTAQGKHHTGLGARPWVYHVKGYNTGPYSTHFKVQGGGLV
jgi:hypothetical protein